jgi:hypothetical protein
MKKLGLILLVVIMALGALGAAYAAWNGTIIATATVNTGSVNAQFDPNYNQNLMYGASQVLATVQGDGSLSITVSNAYPGEVFTNIPFVVDNLGTVPMSVTTVTLNNIQYNGNWVVMANFSASAPAGTIAVGAHSNYGYINFELNQNPNVIISQGQYTFTIDVNYAVVPGP